MVLMEKFIRYVIKVFIKTILKKKKKKWKYFRFRLNNI